jgi:hypothetical protein
MLIDLEHAHAFSMSILGVVEHLRADKGARLRLSDVVSAGQIVILGLGSVLGGSVLVRRKFAHARE